MYTHIRTTMPDKFNDCQSPFIKNNQILDGILIANELVDGAKSAHKETFLYKVDFEKAFDSVNWGFLDYFYGVGMRAQIPQLIN